MAQSIHVEFAFFCAKAERDATHFINVSRLLHTINVVPGFARETTLTLVFGVVGPPSSTHTVQIRMVHPSGLFKDHPTYGLRIGNTGYSDEMFELSRLSIREVGTYLAELRFNGEGAATHAVPFHVLPRVTAPGSGGSTAH